MNTTPGSIPANPQSSVADELILALAYFLNERLFLKEKHPSELKSAALCAPEPQNIKGWRTLFEIAGCSANDRWVRQMTDAVARYDDRELLAYLRAVIQRYFEVISHVPINVRAGDTAYFIHNDVFLHIKLLEERFGKSLAKQLCDTHRSILSVVCQALLTAEGECGLVHVYRT